MDNGTPIEAPSEKHSEKLLKDITVVNDDLDHYLTLLSASQKRHSPKWRRGGENIGLGLVDLIKEHKITIRGTSPEEIVAQQARVARLRPLQLAAKRLARLLQDAMFAAQSKGWSATTDLYSALKPLARRDEALKTQLAPVTQFFATGKRKPKSAAKTPAPATTPTP